MNSSPFRYGLAYILWLITIGLGVVTALVIRDTYRFILISLHFHRYTVYANSQIVTLLLGFVLVLSVIVFEHLYRTAVPQNRLAVRFLLLVGWGCLVLAVVHGVHAVAAYVGNGFTEWVRLTVAAGELVIGLVLLWVRNRLVHNRSKT